MTTDLERAARELIEMLAIREWRRETDGKPWADANAATKRKYRDRVRRMLLAVERWWKARGLGI